MHSTLHLGIRSVVKQTTRGGCGFAISVNYRRRILSHIAIPGRKSTSRTDQTAQVRRASLLVPLRASWIVHEWRPLMPDLKEQIAVVTGASGGIGGAIASAFIRGGAHVVAVGRDIAKLEALVTRLRGLAGTVEAFRSDLTQDDDLSGLAEYVSHSSGRLDILVHSAGVYARGKLEKSSINTMDALYAANVRGPYLLTKELLPFLKRPRGQIAFINSSAGLSARRGRDSFQLLSRRSKRSPTDCARR
jgi:hypothetical protein